MQSDLICPFFNTTKDTCEVEAEFINIEEAKCIIDLCICNYRACEKYKKLNKKNSFFFQFIEGYLLKKIQMGGRND